MGNPTKDCTNHVKTSTKIELSVERMGEGGREGGRERERGVGGGEIEISSALNTSVQLVTMVFAGIQSSQAALGHRFLSLLFRFLCLAPHPSLHGARSGGHIPCGRSYQLWTAVECCVCSPFLLYNYLLVDWPGSSCQCSYTGL